MFTMLALNGPNLVDRVSRERGAIMRKNVGLILTIGIMVVMLASNREARAQTVIGGIPVYCYDFRGIPVTTLWDTALNDVGRAFIDPATGAPIMVLNPTILQSTPIEFQLFVYGHECAHHVLGHTVNPQMINEAQADCLSVTTGRDQGWFPPEAFQYLVQALGSSPGSVWGHLPGPQRIDNMWNCYNNM